LWHPDAGGTGDSPANKKGKKKEKKTVHNLKFS
jgi:hypothetical protein